MDHTRQNPSNNGVERSMSMNNHVADRHRATVEVENGITIIDVSPPSTAPRPITTVVGHSTQEFGCNPSFSDLGHARGESSIGFNLTTRRPDPPPSLVSQYGAAEDTVMKLRTERQTLQLQLSSLQHHLSLHKSQIEHAQDPKRETEYRVDAYRKKLRLLGERRKSLVASHSTSARGQYAKEYRILFAEHIRLEDQLRQITASRVVARYTLQKLIIDVAYSHNSTPPPVTANPIPKRSGAPSTDLTIPVYSALHREVWPSGSVDLMEEAAAERADNPTPVDVAAPKVFATSLATQMDHAVESVLNRWSVKVVEPASQVPVSPLPPLSEPTVQMAGVVDSCHDTPYPVPNSPASVTSIAASSRLTDFMSHILEVLPPPDLSYPPDELDLDQPVLTWETSYMRTQIPEDDPPIEPQDSNGELTTLHAIVDRFIQEKDGHRICTMCSDIVKVPAVVRSDDLGVLLDHLQKAHPRG